MIYDIQKRWNAISPKRVKRISEEFSVSQPAAKKYIHMTEKDIAKLDAPPEYKKRKTVMDDYINIINKMLRDKRKPEVIMSYIVKKGYSGSLRTLEKYITLFAKNNFNIRLTKTWAHISSYPDDVTIIKRNDLFKYMTTKNPKTKKSELVAQNFEIIKEKYSIVAILQEIYDEFYDILMGSIPDELDSFIHKYKDSVIETYIDRMITDIISIKNAISRHESSGFVEGNNNKFKLIKRILYGRANLANLFKKCYVAFKINAEDFDLTKLL